VISGTAEDILWSMEHALSDQTVPAEHEGYMPDDLLETSSNHIVVAAATIPAGKASSTPASQLETVKRFTYRGVEIIASPKDDTYVYTASALSLGAASQRALHLQINARLFRRDTGITNPILEQMYAGADTDRDGYLCWKEIRQFQGGLTRRYEYQNNMTALRPDEFLSQGGGDCEDWALVTCGLLRYWGWDGYVAAFYPPGGGDGHALCMVRWTDMPRGFDYYTVESGSTTVDSQPVHPGYYVPIDYEVVGGCSSAVKQNWLLTTFYTPEKIYGRVM